jgi:F-type H+-transporting ATPase subunit epsilon
MASDAAPGHLRLVIVTPAGSVAKTDVTELVAPGVLGEFGVLPGHLPFLSAILAGVLTYVEGGQTQIYAVGAGFVEVGAGDEVVVLTEAALAPADIDAPAAEQEEREAAAALATLSPAEQAGEFAHRTAVQAWARARLHAVQRSRGAGAS